MNKIGSAEFIDFSLVDGGLLHQIWRRFRLTGHSLKMIVERIGVMLLLVWTPLLVLSVVEGNALKGNLPFLYDIEMNLRLLVVLPLLILAETFVHQRMRLIVGQFLARQLISEKSQSKFDDAVKAAMRLRSSVKADLILLGLVYAIAIFFFQPAFDIVSWRGGTIDGQAQWSLAGGWLRWVSLPLFQFLLLRWYLRIFIWARFLWQVSRLELKIMPTHSDGCGGLSFLSEGTLAFAPILLAQGTLLAAMMTNRIFFAGAKLPDFKMEVFGLVALILFVMIAPLMVFTPKLAKIKRAGRLEYGTLVQLYVLEFDRKWLRGGAPVKEPLIGSADIQSLADLTNSFGVIDRMRPVPFRVQTVLQLFLLTVLPVFPLVLTMIPLRELAARLLKLVI